MLKICGSNTQNCSEKCGGIGCDSCGIGCYSFVNTYSEYKNLKEKINKTIDKKGSDLKDILTQINSNRLGYKKFNDDLETLKFIITDDLIKYQEKKTFVKNLINDMFNLSDKYQSNIESIDKFNQYVIKKEINFDFEKKIDSILELISQKEFSLKKEHNFEQIGENLEKHNQLNIPHINNTKKISKLIANVNNEFNETWSNFNKTRSRIISQNDSLNHVQEMNFKINTTLESLKFKLNTVRSEIDAVNVPRANFKVMNETSIVIMANVGKENLFLIKKKFDIVEKIHKRLTQQLNTSTNYETMINVIQLLDKIMKQSQKLDLKLKKIEKLKIENFQLQTKINSDKSEIYTLTEKMNDLRDRLKVDEYGKIICY